MPEFELNLTFKGWYDEVASALEHADMVACFAERHCPDVTLDVTVKELNP